MVLFVAAKPDLEPHDDPHFRPQLESLDDRILPSLTLATTTPVGSYTDAAVAADVNHDGALDLITANLGTWDAVQRTYVGGGVSVQLGLLGKGNRPTGTFAAAQNYASGPALSVAVGDFDGDGKLDIVTENWGGGVSVLLGRGNGAFRQGPITATGGGSFLAAADVNGDGRLDLITNSGGVTVLLGNGDGSFRTGATYSSVGYAVATGDFNGDGKLDIVTARNPNTFGAGFTLSLLTGNSDGTFASPQTIFVDPVYSSTYAGEFLAITAADLNGDGKLDLAFTHYYEAQVSTDSINAVSGDVLLGNGDGTFRSGGNFSFSGDPFHSKAGLVAAELNRDGKLDLITVGVNAAVGSAAVEVLPGHGDGTFGLERDFAGLGNTYTYTSLVVGDFNGDGYIDVAATWHDYSGASTLNIWLNDRHWSNFV